MKLLYAASLLLITSCIPPDDLDEEGMVESESAPVANSNNGPAGQGSSMQGSSMQGSSMQGSSMQGSSMQGSSMQGSYGSSGVSFASVNGTAIVFWRKAGKTWEQRFPDKICYWNSKRTILDHCTNFLTSPLIGSTWPTTFTKKNADGTTTTIPVTLRIEAVRRDTTNAMHPLTASNFATATVLPYGTQGCENPDGCRPNRDIWNYDVKAIDVVDATGTPQWLCPTGQTSIALAGTWPSANSYQFAPSSTQFTFACTNGTIAKCTRWGYRNYDSAIRDNDQYQQPISMVDYHQACIYAASADYCGIGKSMTVDGTLVDVFDYSYTGSLPPDFNYAGGVGFIPRLDGHVFNNTASVSAFAFEAHFDRAGALFIDHTRYQELSANPSWNIDANCPGRFYESEFFPHHRLDAGFPAHVLVASAPSCSHSEFTQGKYLHETCSNCTAAAPNNCTDPLGGTGWDANCQKWALDNAGTGGVCAGSSNYMASHSECTTGSGLFRYDSGCTLSVCSQYPSCCTAGLTSWTSNCVNAANSVCKGGREGFPLRGFCGTSMIAPPPPGSTL